MINNNDVMCKGNAGTHKYMAPEQFSKRAYNPFKAEIYTLGIFLFHLIYKAFPFQANSSQETPDENAFLISDFEASDRNIYKVTASQSIKDLIEAML